MLSENDMANLSGLTSKLALEGYDISCLRSILAQERERINVAEAADLTAYFPIKDSIQLKLASIKYGLQPLTINLQLIVERLSGVFDANSKPERFEGILKNAIYNCLKTIKAQYAAEVKSLIADDETTIKTATTANPLGFTFNNCTLYAETGSIDTAVSWIVYSLVDKDGNDLSNTGVEATATSEAPFQLKLSDGDGGVKGFDILSGTWDGSEIVASTAVTVSGGIKS